MSGTSKTEWVEALGMMLRGFHHMGLVPEPSADVPSDWEKLGPEQRARWERYAVQVRHAVELMQASEKAGEPALDANDPRRVAALQRWDVWRRGELLEVGSDGLMRIERMAIPWMMTEDGVARLSGPLTHPTEGMEQPRCTGIAASWCPIHGDCKCPTDENGERWEEDEKCPLHGSGSTHGDDAREV